MQLLSRVLDLVRKTAAPPPTTWGQAGRGREDHQEELAATSLFACNPQMHYTHQQLFAGQKSISSSQRAAPDRIRAYIFL
jgi:hypothetical protein